MIKSNNINGYTYIIASEHVEIHDNIIKNKPFEENPAIEMYYIDNISIRRNNLDGTESNSSGGIFISNSQNYNNSLIDSVHSNTIVGYERFAIDCNFGYQVNTVISNNKISNFTNGSAIDIHNSTAEIINNYIHASGSDEAKGIFIQNYEQNQPVKILHNSVNVTSQDPINGRALEVNSAQNLQIKNNIFANNGGGYAAYISPIPPNLTIDYNNYYSTGNDFGYINGTEYSSIATWGVATTQDANSWSVPPFFTNDTTLVPNHILLNNAGELLAEVTLDIDGTTRGALPDLGAKEFSPCQPDAGINRFVNLQNPIPGQNNITVELQNQGTSALNEVTIHWRVNGVEQPAFTWTGNLATTTNTNINIGTYNLSAGALYQLQAWTSLPIGTIDCNHLNDTCQTLSVGLPLCGTLTLGGPTADFANFTEAAYALNTFGVACPVTILVNDGIYNEQVTLYDFPGSSNINTVTFQGASGDSSMVNLTFNDSLYFSAVTLTLIGTKNTSFSDLSLLAV
jgi:hypothetical protein